MGDSPEFLAREKLSSAMIKLAYKVGNTQAMEIFAKLIKAKGHDLGLDNIGHPNISISTVDMTLEDLEDVIAKLTEIYDREKDPYSTPIERWRAYEDAFRVMMRAGCKKYIEQDSNSQFSNEDLKNLKGMLLMAEEEGRISISRGEVSWSLFKDVGKGSMEISVLGLDRRITSAAELTDEELKKLSLGYLIGDEDIKKNEEEWIKFAISQREINLSHKCGLSNRQAQIVARREHGVSTQAIMEEFNCSPQAVSDAYSKGMLKLKLWEEQSSEQEYGG